MSSSSVDSSSDSNNMQNENEVATQPTLVNLDNLMRKTNASGSDPGASRSNMQKQVATLVAFHSMIMEKTEAPGSGAASSSGSKTSSFKKVLTKADVGRNKNRLSLLRKDVNTHIVPHLSQEQMMILRKKDIEEPLEIMVIDDKYGTQCSMDLFDTGVYYRILGSAPLVILGNFQENQVIEIRWRDGALHISY